MKLSRNLKPQKSQICWNSPHGYYYQNKIKHNFLTKKPLLLALKRTMLIYSKLSTINNTSKLLQHEKTGLYYHT